jgi:lipid II:glycine glycyltransferase (peptidoglycan interpeptide bridge formation enzyme)
MSYDIKIAKDESKWENAVDQFNENSIFLSWNWSEFEKNQGEHFWRYAVYNEADEIVGLLPIKLVQALRGRYLHLRHAPALDWGNQELVAAVNEFLMKFTKKNNAFFFRISPLIGDNESNRELLKNYGFKPATAHMVDAEKTLVIDLTKSEDELLSYMRKNTRYNIRKSKREGISVKNVGDLSLFNEFVDIYRDTVKRQGWVAYSTDYIKAEYEMFAKDDMSRMFVAYYKGNPIAASIFLFYKNEVVYHHSGSYTKYRDLPSSYAIQWAIIKYAKEQGFKKYNLWGVCEKDDKDHPWYGLSLFKYGFGGDVRDMVHARDYIVLPLAYATRLYEWGEKKLRGY